MRDPNKPDTQADEYLPDLRYAHKNPANAGDQEGVNPREPASMPRAEDDPATWADSPEYNDRTDVPEGGTTTPPNIKR